MLWSIPFFLVVGIALPYLAWASNRWVHSTDAKEEDLPTLRALGWQTVFLQGIVLGTAALAAWGEGLEIRWASQASLAGALLAIGIVTSALLVAWVESLRPLEPGDLLRRQLRRVRAGDPVWLLVTMLAATAEEFAYRGVLTQLFAPKLGPMGASLASAVIFGLGHMAQGWKGAVFSAAYGLGMQGVIAVSGGLWMAILAHGFYDLVAFAIGRQAAKREQD